MRGIDKARRLRIGVRQVNLDIAPCFGDLCSDPDVIAAMAIVVEECFAVEHAVFPCGDHRSRLMLSSVEDGLYRRFDNRRTEFRKQPRQPTLSEMSRSYHRRQIASELARIANIQGQQLEEIITQPPPFVELDRGNAQSLLPDFGR